MHPGFEQGLEQQTCRSAGVISMVDDGQVPPRPSAVPAAITGQACAGAFDDRRALQVVDPFLDQDCCDGVCGPLYRGHVGLPDDFRIAN